MYFLLWVEIMEQWQYKFENVSLKHLSQLQWMNKNTAVPLESPFLPCAWNNSSWTRSKCCTGSRTAGSQTCRDQKEAQIMYDRWAEDEEVLLRSEHSPWVILGPDAGLELQTVPSNVLGQLVDDGLDVRRRGNDGGCLWGNWSFQFQTAGGKNHTSEHFKRNTDCGGETVTFRVITSYLVSAPPAGAAEVVTWEGAAGGAATAGASGRLGVVPRLGPASEDVGGAMTPEGMLL